MTMPADTPWGIFVATFLYSLAGGIIPFLNVEAYLLAVSALYPRATMVPVVVASTAGQMAAKSLLYLAGRGLLRLPIRKSRELIERTSARLANYPHGSNALVALSAVTGLPPFYAVSVAAGALRLNFAAFFVIGTVGRAVRFAAVFWLPRMV
jgi:membrane protein YqaA with SNARE-associated domain